mmetsp:Transcript_36983/g.73592  ORF Transcript_36983/g.73592 Transcript_36983/m.73592 type:complete len:263 (-) Transcript_36983:1210-1998(-)
MALSPSHDTRRMRTSAGRLQTLQMRPLANAAGKSGAVHALPKPNFGSQGVGGTRNCRPAARCISLAAVGWPLARRQPARRSDQKRGAAPGLAGSAVRKPAGALTPDSGGLTELLRPHRQRRETGTPLATRAAHALRMNSVRHGYRLLGRGVVLLRLAKDLIGLRPRCWRSPCRAPSAGRGACANRPSTDALRLRALAFNSAAAACAPTQGALPWPSPMWDLQGLATRCTASLLRSITSCTTAIPASIGGTALPLLCRSRRMR